MTANYQTPMGAFEFWSDAADACERADLDPCECIKYVGAGRAGPTSVQWEIQDGQQDIKLSFGILVF